MIGIDELAEFSHRLISQGQALAQRVQELEKENTELKAQIETSVEKVSD